ncbi:Uu.00g081140.m01.CDS01 [Anthostomella pinea]|uniref:Uu.00g081140.m01.CDS01 n=1 Tax=Anthostomella pinea TaxID=933095 RepID=A0AAI8VL72_9PEZI|nr:Uu.00g081140.m01.CDS01 [Anthostomella pinea]
MRANPLILAVAVAGSLASVASFRSVALQDREIQYCGAADQPTIRTCGDPEVGPGIWVTNHDKNPNVKYFLYENSRDEHPWKYLDIPQGTRAFLQVCPTFQGRMVRGTVAVNTNNMPHMLGTWIEFSIVGGTIWGDISFLEGSDGGALMATTDGSGLVRECVVDLLTAAPSHVLRVNDAGVAVVDTVVDKPWRATNHAARAWLNARCDENQIYIQEPNQAIIASSDGRFEVMMVDGVA